MTEPEFSVSGGTGALSISGKFADRSGIQSPGIIAYAVTKDETGDRTVFAVNLVVVKEEFRGRGVQNILFTEALKRASAQ